MVTANNRGKPVEEFGIQNYRGEWISYLMKFRLKNIYAKNPFTLVVNNFNTVFINSLRDVV